MIPFSKWQRARDKACAALLAGESLLLLTGPAGTGKSVLLQDMARILRYAGWQVTLRVAGMVSEDDRSTSEAQAALMIDEADRLSDAELQAATDGWSGALVLAGLDALGSRCEAGTRLSLLPMHPAESRAYIAQWLAAAKQEPNRLEAEAVERIVALSGGVPRMLSALLSAVVWMADASGAPGITRQDVNDAAALRACLIGEEGSGPVVSAPSPKPRPWATVLPPVEPAADEFAPAKLASPRLALVEPAPAKPALAKPAVAELARVQLDPVESVPVELTPVEPTPAEPAPAEPVQAAFTPIEPAAPVEPPPVKTAPVTATVAAVPARARRHSVVGPAVAAAVVLGAASAVAAYREWPQQTGAALERVRAIAGRLQHPDVSAAPVATSQVAAPVSFVPAPPSLVRVTAPAPARAQSVAPPPEPHLAAPAAAPAVAAAPIVKAAAPVEPLPAPIVEAAAKPVIAAPPVEPAAPPPVVSTSAKAEAAEPEAVVPHPAPAPVAEAPRPESTPAAPAAPIVAASLQPAAAPVAPPAASGALAPTPLAPTPLAPALVETLVRRGTEMFALGDISAARLLFNRAVQAGNADAMLALGRTYDPLALTGPGEGSAADPAVAAQWYRRARAAGSAEAAPLLQRLEQQASR